MNDTNQDPFAKPYDPKNTEKRIYEKWEKSGFFTPENSITAGHIKSDAPVFSIVLPPPNVTGILHMGHAAMLSIEDIIVRTKRMQGYRTLWLPGTDHAAIATQSRVEKDMAKEGLRKHDMSREDFLKRVNDFADQSRSTIISQTKAMGASVDWTRLAFTLDEKRSRAVRYAFKKMYDDGLIYRGYRIVNWDPKGQTTISDDEIVYEERDAMMYTFRYSKDFPIPIATTRPETKVGDTGVAVHPEDERYAQYIGKSFDIVFAGVPLKIKVVGDREVDMNFGTGAVGVTPAHSKVDWEIGARHGLEVKPVIDEFAKMTVGDETILGKKVLEARENIVAWLKTEELLSKEEKIKQNVSTAERTGGIIEPLPKLQWFIDVNKEFTLPHSPRKNSTGTIGSITAGSKTTLKKIMREAVESSAIKIIPEHLQKVYFHWIENLNDWCISRQIWYGHRIPVWYKGEEIFVGEEAPDGSDWTQDNDTLDTWFSSGLWTFSTLGWPETTDDLEIYHPTSLLETGHDILFFWVARMILMTVYFLGEIPFKDVYMHGIVRDAKGQKMSKSLGNAMDPLEMIEKYGTDATRMSLIIGNTPGSDMRISEDKVRAQKNFANKIWNITRFVTLSTADYNKENPPKESELDEADVKYISEMNMVIDDITEEINQYHLYLAAEKTYHYVWHTFADIIIEESKKKIIEAEKSGDTKAKRSAQYTLSLILENSLKILHPFMPFVTEEIWSIIKPNEGLLLIQKWPTSR